MRKSRPAGPVILRSGALVSFAGNTWVGLLFLQIEIAIGVGIVPSVTVDHSSRRRSRPVEPKLRDFGENPAFALRASGRQPSLSRC